jgi:hypothetical protein
VFDALNQSEVVVDLGFVCIWWRYFSVGCYRRLFEYFFVGL